MGIFGLASFGLGAFLGPKSTNFVRILKSFPGRRAEEDERNRDLEPTTLPADKSGAAIRCLKAVEGRRPWGIHNALLELPDLAS